RPPAGSAQPGGRSAPPPGRLGGSPRRVAGGRPSRPARTGCRPGPRAGPVRRCGCQCPWGDSLDLLRPDNADQPELALDGAGDVAQPAGDLGGCGPLHLPDRHRLQLGVAQGLEQPAALVGHLGREGGAGLGTDHPIQGGRIDLGGGALLAALVTGPVEGLVRRVDDQEPPQLVAVAKLWEPPVHHPAITAVQDAEGHVCLGSGRPRHAAEARAGQLHQSAEVAVPERLCRRLVTGLELGEPTGDRTWLCHVRPPPFKRWEYPGDCNAGARTAKGKFSGGPCRSFGADGALAGGRPCPRSSSLRQGRPQRLLETAAEKGGDEDEGWLRHKDGVAFWTTITPLPRPVWARCDSSFETHRYKTGAHTRRRPREPASGQEVSHVQQVVSSWRQAGEQGVTASGAFGGPSGPRHPRLDGRGWRPVE